MKEEGSEQKEVVNVAERATVEGGPPACNWTYKQQTALYVYS
jgi:hypothetical protein